MHLRILGTRGNIESSAPGHTKHSGILVDDRLLFDVGEKHYLRYAPKYIFITHLHPDHAVLDPHNIPKHTVVYAPESDPRLSMLRVISQAVDVDSYKVIPIPTVHSQRVKSVGYVVERGGQRIFYSSDMVKIKPRYHALLENLDLVITEGSYIRSQGLVRLDTRTGRPFGHNGIPELVEFFSRFTRCILITHFGTWFYKDLAASRRKLESLGNGVRVIAAYDGMRVNVSSLCRGGWPLNGARRFTARRNRSVRIAGTRED
jgi:ribonuclease BN (tRNA processing enzyme)